MLQRSVTLIRKLVCTRPRRSVRGDLLVISGIITFARPAVAALWFDAGVYPFVRSVGPLFAFPNRHILLERVDQPLAGGERVAAVGRADGDRHAGLGRRHAAEAMNNHTFYHGPTLAGFGFQ